MPIPPPPGWYASPDGTPGLQWWDGNEWTGHRAPPPSLHNPMAGVYDGRAGLHRAGFGPRAAAFLLDSLVVSVVTMPLYMIWFMSLLLSMDFTTSSSPAAFEANFFGGGFIAMWLIMMLLSFLFPLVYGTLFEGGRYGQTIGKWTMGLAVRRPDGLTPLGRGRALKRALVRIPSTMALYLGCLWMLWDDDGRTWHDMAADTRVFVVTDKPAFKELLRSAFRSN